MQDEISTTNANANKNEEDEEISLIDLFAVLLHYKKLIIGVTVAAMVGVLLFSILSLKLPADVSPLPNKFTPKGTMLINDAKGSGASISSSMSSAASLFGISLGGGGSKNGAFATYLATSDEILDAISEKFNVVERYEIKKSPIANARKTLLEKLKVDTDTESGVFIISFTDIDPQFACDVVNYTIDLLEKRFNELGVDTNSLKKKNLEMNIESTYKEILRLQKETEKLGNSVLEDNNPWNIPAISVETTRLQMELNAQQEVYKQLRTQYELLKIDMESEQPIFQILMRPQVPDLKSSPSRGKLCIIVTFAAVFLSIFLAFLLNAIKNIKNDPEAMKKLSSANK